MIVATSETIAGYEIAQTIGVVRGSTVRTNGLAYLYVYSAF